MPSAELPAVARGAYSSEQARALIETYRSEAEKAEPLLASRLLHEVARLYEEVLDDPRSAARVLLEALSTDPASLLLLRAALRLVPAEGNLELAAELLERAADSVESVGGRVALLSELAAFQELRLGDERTAAESYRRVRQEDPANLGAAEALLRLSLHRRDDLSAARLCRELADVEQDPLSRCSLQLLAALLASDEAEGVARARLAAQALSSDHTADLAAALAVTLFCRHGGWEEALELLQSQTRQRPTEAALQLQISRILESSPGLGQAADAIRHAQLAASHCPDDLALLEWLAQLLRGDARWAELVEVLRRQQAMAIDPAHVAALHVDAAEVLEGRLHNTDDAIDELEQALRTAPDDPVALQLLGWLYAREERWEQLARMYLAEAESTADRPFRQVAALYLAGCVLSERLGQSERAIKCLEQAIALDVTHEPALARLEQLYRREGRHRQLRALHELRVEHAEPGEQRVTALLELAALLEHGFGDTGKAAAIYEEIEEAEQLPVSSLVARALVRLHGAREDATALLGALRRLEPHVEGSRRRAAVLMHLSQLQEDHPGDTQSSLTRYQTALELDPTTPGLCRQLGRLYLATGRWQDLVALHRVQIEQSATPEERVRWLCRIGSLHERALADPVAAAEAYREALELEGGSRLALEGLLRTAPTPADLQRAIELAPLDRHGAACLVQAGLNAEDRFQDLELAQRCYSRAMELDPYGALAKPLLLHATVARGEWENALELLSPFAGALVALGGLGQPSRALELLGRHLEREPSSLGAVRWLEVLHAARGERREHVRALARRAELEPDSIRRSEVRLRVAAMAEVDDLPELDPVAIYQAVAADLPGDRRPLVALERLARVRGELPLLLEVLEQLADRGGTAVERAAALSGRAHLLFQSGLADKALASWRAALEADAACRPAYDALKYALWERVDGETLEWALERGLEMVEHPKAKLTDLLRRADVRREHGNWQGALADLDQVLAIKPGHADALERLVRLLTEQGEFHGLARRLEEAARQTSAPVRQAALLRQLGLLHREQFGDLQRAAASLERAIAVDPDNVEALLAAADLKLELEQPTEALALLNRVVLRASNKKDLHRARLEAARIYQEVLGDPIRAHAALEAILEERPDHIGALRQLARVAEQQNDMQRLEEYLERLCLLEDGPQLQAEALAGLSALRRKRQGPSHREALRPLEQALDLAPGNATWLLELANCYEAAKRWSDLDRLLERQVGALDAEAQPPFLLMHGRVLGHLGRLTEARVVLRQVLREEPDNEAAIELLLDQLDGSPLRDPELLSEAIALQRALMHRRPLTVGALRTIHQLCRKAGRIDESFCAGACLVLLGEATEEEAYFHRQLRQRAPRKATGTLSREQVRALILPGGDHPARRLLSVLRPHLPALHPPDLAHYGLEVLGATRLAADHSAWDVASICGRVLKVADYDLVEAKGGAPHGACLPGKPPTILLPRNFLRLPMPDQLFLCGRLLARLAASTETLDPGGADPWTARNLEILAVALRRIGDLTYGSDLAPEAILDDIAGRLRALLSAEELATARAVADEVCAELNRASLGDWVWSTEVGACQGGMLCSGGLDALAPFWTRGGGPVADDVLRKLILFATSAQYAELRRALDLNLPDEG
jgi:tetratricopeptide (TPR) repeat protein